MPALRSFRFISCATVFISRMLYEFYIAPKMFISHRFSIIISISSALQVFEVEARTHLRPEARIFQKGITWLRCKEGRAENYLVF